MRSLLIDGRVPVVRKVVFLATIIGLAVLLIFPDVFNEAFLSTVLPLVGTVLGIPIDAGFDWVTFALATMGLLHVFPTELVAEHYESIFHHKQLY